jgi:hypothetical protein
MPVQLQPSTAISSFEIPRDSSFAPFVIGLTQVSDVGKNMAQQQSDHVKIYAGMTWSAL